MDKAKMLEKAKATREAKAAASQREVVTQPEGPQTAQVGLDVAPWDEPGDVPREGLQTALGGHGLSGEGVRVHLSIDEDSGPPW